MKQIYLNSVGIIIKTLQLLTSSNNLPSKSISRFFEIEFTNIKSKLEL